MINKSNMNKLAAVLVSCFAVVGCSSSNSGSSDSSTSSNSNNGDVSSLQIVAPKTIFSKPAESSPGYIVIKNPTDAAVNNLNYSLANLVGGAKGTIIDPDSAANCATMPAHGQCNVKVMIPAGAVAGSFGFSANNDSSLLSKLGKVFKDSVTKTSNLTIGIQQAAYNNLSGADGITLSYYHTVINGVPYILVTGLVASANAGSFNNIVLVDNNGNAIPGQSLIGSSSGYTQGTTFQVLLPVPASGGITQTIKVQTQQVSNGQTKVVSTSTSSSTLTTTEGVGIVDLLPDAVYLTKDNPEQMITFSNTGDAEAQLQSLLASNPNLEVIFSQGSLGSGETTIATIKMKDPTVPATSGDVTLTYNNGKQEVSDSVVADQNVNPAPTPSPTPTPTPAPGPSPTPAPTPVAGLTATLSPDNDFFMTTAISTVTRQMTITNTGDTDENGIVLTLPTGFSISDGNSNNKCSVSGNNITNTLNTAANKSCDVTVTYANTSAVDPAQSASISIAYKYNNSTPAPSPATAAVNYRVTQSTANLSLQTPTDPFSFPTTLFEGLGVTEQQVYTIKNTGDGEATSMSPVVNSTTSAGLFSSYTVGLANACGAILAAGASCEYGVQFGAIPDGTSAGQKAGNLTVSYKTYPTAASPTDLIANFYGQVATANSAVFSTPTGTAGSSFQGTWPNLTIVKDTSTNNTITYTITNSGTDVATDFRVTLPGAPDARWNTPTTDCPTTTGTNLAINGSCTINITPVTASTGTVNATTMTVAMAWSDQDSPSGETQNMQLSLPAVQVYIPAAITIAPVANWQTVMGTAYAFTATITNAADTVSFSSFSSSISGASLSSSSCSLDPVNNPNCTVIVTPYNTDSTSYSYWNPASITNSSVGNEITVSSASGIGFTATATGSSTTINGSASPQTFSNIAGTVIAPYVYLQAPMVGAASTTNTGISWGSGGTVSTRFEAGTQNGGGTCSNSQKDNLTELEWVKAPTSTTYTWANAKTAPAIPASLCGYNDWRLPTITELLSLFNYAAASGNQANWLNTQGFTNVKSYSYWSSTPGGTVAWGVNMDSGGSGSGGTVASVFNVWPVRGGQ